MSSLQELAVALERNLTESFELSMRNPRLYVKNWLVTCDEIIHLLKNPLRETECTVSVKQSVMATLERLKGLRVRAERSYVLIAQGGGLQPSVSGRVERVCWQDLETAFEDRLRTGVVINLDHIDPRQFLEHAGTLIQIKVKNDLERNICVKVNTEFNGEYVLREEKVVKCFNTRNKQLFLHSDLTIWYEHSVVMPTLSQMEEFQERDSGWTLHNILNITVNINRCEPLNGSCYFPLPRDIALKKAVINVRSSGDVCFAWAVVSALYSTKNNSNLLSSYPNYRHVLNLTDITFPMTIRQIPIFETQNRLSINVFLYDTARQIVPLYVTGSKRNVHINLLLITNPDTGKSHFCWIKNLSRLVASQLSRSQKRVYVCERCLHVFYREERLIAHTKDCGLIDPCAVILLTPDNNVLRFKNFTRKNRMPYIVYADFECLLKNLSEQNAMPGTSMSTSSSLVNYQKHEAYSVGYHVHCSHDTTQCRYRSYRGPNPAAWFVRHMTDLVSEIKSVYDNFVPLQADRQTEMDYALATHCHICEQEFDASAIRVRDHCHITGRYRGAAHQGCNLNYQDAKVIPVVFHNLSGYDAHFVIQELVTAFRGEVSVLPLNKEKYISFTKRIYGFRLRFIDSFRFLNTSLDKLVSYLDPGKLHVLRTEFRHCSADKMTLLSRKGIFPYDYVDSIEKLKETSLPPIEGFHNKSNDSPLQVEDYQHATTVWDSFGLSTLGAYSDLYLKTDVLLLADVFENFRYNCLKTYGLDPAYYYTLPGFAWDAMLKITDVRLDLITDINMLLCVERGIRGGLSQCSNRYSEANNRYMADFDPTKASKYLMYFDENNLYGWAMSQYLPIGGFEWVTDFRGIVETADDADVGYILEVDLKYPQSLHDRHQDLPFCPERESAPNTKDVKLLATLHDKVRYVIHYRNLKQCISHGLQLTRIHRVLRFRQSVWLGAYIDTNTRLRTRSENDFDKNLYKLMNNAVFGKTMENVRNHVDIKLISKWDGRYGAKSLISKPNFHRRTIFAPNFVAIEMKKLQVKINKPVYLGMCILDISKTQLYKFHYEYMKSEDAPLCKLMYTDTDSLIYEISCDDFYEKMKDDIDQFDTSDYEPGNAYGIPLRNKKVPGLMKDENAGKIMTHFVGLRSKMYAFKVNDRETKKSKGIKQYVVSKYITFQDYVDCLRTMRNLRTQQNSIRSKLHKVYSTRETKVALSADDAKRYIVRGSTDTLPWGHYRVASLATASELK